MFVLNLEEMTSLRVQLACQKFLGLKREDTKITFEDFSAFYSEAYKMTLPGIGKKSVAESAFVLCYAIMGDKSTKEEMIDSCAELLSHPCNDADCWNVEEWGFWKYAREAANAFEHYAEITLD